LFDDVYSAVPSVVSAAAVTRLFAVSH